MQNKYTEFRPCLPDETGRNTSIYQQNINVKRAALTEQPFS